MVEFSLISVFLCGLVLVLALLLKYLRKQSNHENLPHGSMGLPFCGETLGFLKPHESFSLGSFLQQRCSRYGKVFKSHLFGSPTIVSCDCDFNMFILQNEGKLFEADYPKVMHYILGNLSLIVVTGDLHKKLRSTAVSFVCAAKCQSTFLPSVEKLALSSVNSWRHSKQVGFYVEAKKFTICAMLKLLLDINPDKPLGSEILENFETYMSGFISFPLNIPGTTFSNAVKARIRLSSIVKEIIIKRRRGDNVGSSEGEGLLNVILSKPNLCVEEMVSIVLDLMFGGYETTAKLLSLIAYFLGQSPDLLERLKEEHQVIRKSKVDGESLNWEDFKQMKFTLDVINEATRYGNVVKFLHRKAIRDVKFKDFVIPAGWKVLPILSAGHLDPLFHENPSKFDPSRWEDTSTCKKVTAFGGGSRLCPGADIARVEIAFFLHHLVLNYRWKIKSDDCPLAIPYVEFTQGLLLDLEKLSS
ncbi:cytochrome P450 724B1-like [Prosopis cineraria]|uniref:cytochrome P450 724B1-like n=1 Tax=Prosopis cineraria TaxID=364024 RepID=UPI00240ED4D9|nr:cytochrome P450 724B1-like [Prosopis cineraria]